MAISAALAAVSISCASLATAGTYDVTVSGDRMLLNNTPTKIIGLRCSNALVSDASKDQLINNLPVFKSYGINTVSVFVMGSRFGDVKGYNPDSSLNTTYSARLGEIIEAADAEGMIVLVGCLYWGTSAANDALGAWTQAHANQAVANTVQWLKNNNYHNVFVDPDNEGMANAKKGWNISQMIAAGHAVDNSYVIGYNDEAAPPANADVLLHFSPKDGTRPWIESEGSADNSGPQYYWGTYSKQSSFDNYVRIGRYTDAMKTHHYNRANSFIDGESGYMFASTWLQCGPNEGIGGPFMVPGGYANNESNWNQDPITEVLPDAGIVWWLEHIQSRYGAWAPPGGANTGTYKIIQKGSGHELALASDIQNNGNANAEPPSSADDHLWEKIDAGSGWFYLRNKKSGHYLNVSGANTGEDANIAQWATASGDHYAFREVADNGYVLLQIKHSLGYLDTIGGGAGTNAQQTLLISDRARWTSTAAGSYVKYAQKTTGLELALASDTQNNGNITVEASGSDADHYWTIENSGEGQWFYLKNQKSGQYLNVSGGNGAEDANIAQWPTAGNDHYKVRTIADGLHQLLEVKHSGLFIRSISGSNGSNVQQNSGVTDRARWTLVPQ